MSRITTHVLDTMLGRPAAGVSVQLDQLEADERKGRAEWARVATGITDADGRCSDLKGDAESGIYRLKFNTGGYLRQQNRTSIYPEVSITFQCDGAAHYHLPLLLSDNGYTTYRGS